MSWLRFAIITTVLIIVLPLSVEHLLHFPSGASGDWTFYAGYAFILVNALFGMTKTNTNRTVLGVLVAAATVVFILCLQYEWARSILFLGWIAVMLLAFRSPKQTGEAGRRAPQSPR